MRGGKRKGAGRPALPDNQRKAAIYIKLPPNLIKFMDERGKGQRPALIEQAMVKEYNLCPACFKPLHKFHHCELNPIP